MTLKRMLAMCGSLLLLVALTTDSRGAPLLSETFPSATPDAMWEFNVNPGGCPSDGGTGVDGNAGVEDPGDGDFAAFSHGPLNWTGGCDDWDYNIYSVNPIINRSPLNTRTTFQVWWDPNFTVWNYAGGNPGAINNTTINGPYHNTKYPTDPASGVEGGCSGWNGGGVNFQLGSRAWNDPANPRVPNIEAAFIAAQDRASSIWIRSTLGPNNGSDLEMSTDGTTFTMEADEKEAVDGLPAPNGPSAQLYLGWHSRMSKVYIDNILVEDNHNLVPVELSLFEME